MSQEVRQFTVQPDDDGIRLDRWFKRHLPQVGFATVSRWARTGQVRVDGKRVKPEDRLAAGQVVRVPPGGEASRAQPKRRELTPAQIEQAEAMVIRRTDAALVLNKPPGLATQGGTGTHNHVDGLLDAYVEGEGPRPRLVHRLDKDTSGVLLVARTPGSAAITSRSSAFMANRIRGGGADSASCSPVTLPYTFVPAGTTVCPLDATIASVTVAVNVSPTLLVLVPTC